MNKKIDENESIRITILHMTFCHKIHEAVDIYWIEYTKELMLKNAKKS